ncbi:MAG: hypothetical protein H6Q90_5994 [Deltaproteobacteria bacterium]|nr:hypothetical protein [Deltaproteobacteria bacterium]
MDTHYLNTDLDVVTSVDPAPLVAAIEARGGSVMAVQPEGSGWRAVFEINAQHDLPEPTIHALLDLVGSLDGEAGAAWTGAQVRELNIGYDCGDGPWGFHQSLSPSTLARIAAANVGLRWTLYPERSPV